MIGAIFPGQVGMSEPIAFLNGEFVPQSQALIPFNDAGFIYGATVTDLCRTFRHRLFRWPVHLARFRRSCTLAHFDVSISDADITKCAEELITHNSRLNDANDDLALVLFATPGPVGFYLGQSTTAGERPTFGMHTFPLPFPRYRPWIEHGVALATPSVRAVPPACVDPHIKQRSRMHWWLADQAVQRTHPGAHALLLDLDGHVTETASSNFLIVKDGKVISPPREIVLDGVSQRVVSEICTNLGIDWTYRDISLTDCYEADEALLTCTSYCIAGVRSINEHEFPWPGAMLKRLVEAWSTDVGMDIHGQITSQRPV